MKKHQQELLELNDLLNEKADRYKQLAAIDPLTNLYNRYKFIELFTTEVHSMKQRQQAVSLLLLDIDHFKQVNDTYGHNMGDEILVAISKQLTAIVRNIDVVSRWGGEEFLVMLPTAELEQARIIAEKIRTLIEKTEFPEGLSVTMSIGIHQIDLDDGLEETISKADTALYRAKNNGRNRVDSYIEEARLTKNR
jgi:diguanylate cyclase (GGDEF)-like protein